jgi:hypothetical protein
VLFKKGMLIILAIGFCAVFAKSSFDSWAIIKDDREIESKKKENKFFIVITL